MWRKGTQLRASGTAQCTPSYRMRSDASWGRLGGKKRSLEADILAFTEADSEGVTIPHNDPIAKDGDLRPNHGIRSGREGYPLVDIMTGENEPSPKVAERILCRHPFSESKRAYIVPQRVEELLKCYWPQNLNKSRELPSLNETRDRCLQQLCQMRSDHMRRLNPTPYKVSVSAKLYDFIHFLWLNEAPVGELR